MFVYVLVVNHLPQQLTGTVTYIVTWLWCPVWYCKVVTQLLPIHTVARVPLTVNQSWVPSGTLSIPPGTPIPWAVSFGSKVPCPKHPCASVSMQFPETPWPLTQTRVPSGAGSPLTYTHPPKVWGSLGSSGHPLGLNGKIVCDPHPLLQLAAIAGTPQSASARASARIVFLYFMISCSSAPHLKVCQDHRGLDWAYFPSVGKNGHYGRLYSHSVGKSLG